MKYIYNPVTGTLDDIETPTLGEKYFASAETDALKDMMNEQIGMSRQMMDPNSQMNMRMRNLMAQRSAESGAQSAQQMQKMGAMTGMSAGQAAMQQRMAMNESMGGVNQQWQQGLQGQMDKGMGLFGQMQQEMKSYNQADVNSYMGQINAANQRRSGNMAMGMGLLSSVVSGGMSMLGGSEST